MVDEEFSCIKEATKIVNLTLPSMYNTNEISGICDTLESWKRQYIKQLQGIVVGYKNVSLTSKRGYLKADCPIIYCNVKATFELFYPTIGSIIKGKINRISHDYIGCIVHDTINVTVNRTAEISNEISKFIALDHFILFQITRINFRSKFIHVKGKITEECLTLMRDSDLFSDNIVASENNMVSYSNPSFPTNNSSIFYNDPIISTNADQKTSDFDSSIENSSQTLSPKKKKKHKKSKDNSKVSISLKNESLKNNINTVELTNVPDNIKKRKRKRSHSDLTSSTNELENETERMHPKKKIKTEKNAIINNTMEMSDDDASYKFPTILNFENKDRPGSSTSEEIPLKNEKSPKKSDLSIDVKKKKHKKTKKSLGEVFTQSDQIIKTETNDLKSAVSPIMNSSKNSEEDFLTSPDLFDDSSNQIEIENGPIMKPKKKKKKDASDKKDRKKKKDKLKKGSKKDKLKKDSKKDKSKKDSKKDKKTKKKVISTKKKLHGHTHSSKSKKKNTDKKSKKPKKIKKEKSNVPE